MAHDKVYGICQNKCKVSILSKNQAYGVDSMQEFENFSGTSFFEYDKPNYKMIYYNATSVLVSLPMAIKELVKSQPNFNATIILHLNNEYGPANTNKFNTLLANIFKVRFADAAYNVKFFAPSDLNPANCTTLHFRMFFDGMNICCDVNGY